MINTVAIIVHDTRRIISANDAACALFGCERLALIDHDMIELIASEDMRGLARLRMKIMRDREPPLPNIKYPFQRCDGSVFWASVYTRLLRDLTYETTIVYEYER